MPSQKLDFWCRPTRSGRCWLGGRGGRKTSEALALRERIVLRFADDGTTAQVS